MIAPPLGDWCVYIWTDGTSNTAKAFWEDAVSQGVPEGSTQKSGGKLPYPGPSAVKPRYRDHLYAPDTDVIPRCNSYTQIQ